MENDKVFVDKLIVCTKTCRGIGNDKSSPIRSITEIFNLDGELIAENDPHSYSIETIIDFMKWHFRDIPEKEIRQKVYEYFVVQ